MFEQLKTKLLSWTPELANNFHENVTRQGRYAWRIWETTSTGYYFYDGNCAEYRDYNGDTWILMCGDRTESLQVQAALADYHEANNLIRCDKPVVIELHQIHRLTFTLTKIESPYGTRGISAEQLHRVNNGLPILIDLTKKCLLAGNKIVETLDLLPGFNNKRYPSELLFHQFKYDPLTDNFFMSGIQLTETREHFINFLDMAIDLLNFGLEIVGYTYDLKTELATFRESECITLQHL